jgi:predicted nuclease with TOPRIM domain
MKNILAFIFVAGMMALTRPGYAIEQKDSTEKELCLLYARDCAEKVYNLQEKIKRIQEEIAKGSTVYKPEEVKKLKAKLKEAEDMMEALMPDKSLQQETK